MGEAHPPLGGKKKAARRLLKSAPARQRLEATLRLTWGVAGAATVGDRLYGRQGLHVRGRSHYGRCRDRRLLALTHNVLILLRGGFSAESF